VSEQFLYGTSPQIRLFSASPWYGRFTYKGGYNQGYLATIIYKLEILRLKMGMYDITNDCIRNSSGDEIANVNFLYDNTVHALQNTIHLCINSATDRRGYVLKRMFTKFNEITQCNGHYAVQGHSRPPILIPIESSYTTFY